MTPPTTAELRDLRAIAERATPDATADPALVVRLIDALLAERDETPIDEDWLRSVGFKDYCAPDKWCSSYLSLWIDPRQHNVAFVAVHWARDTHPTGSYWSANGFSLYKPAYPKTRGDLRLLCKALGIELEDGK